MLADAGDQLGWLAEKAQLVAVSQSAPNEVEDGGIRVENSHVRRASCPGCRYGFSK
jgi:hypothetical protein